MLIIVRKIWFDELRSGAKRVEYRRYGRTFNERVFYIGRLVAFAYRRDRVSPRLTGPPHRIGSRRPSAPLTN